jgi:hypothetical protein
MDEARKPVGQDLVIAQAPLLQRPGAEIFDQHIGVGKKAQDQIAPLPLRQVDRNAALVAVGAEIVGGGAVDERWPPGPRLVTLRRLHFDHVGAVIGQRLGTGRPAQDPRQVDDLDAVERAFRLCRRHDLPSSLHL